MRINSYPRPHNDSGIGFHYFPDADHYARGDLDLWLPRLDGLGVSWLVMETSPTRPIPDRFLQRVMLADIEPIVVIKPELIRPLDQLVLRETVRALADSGVHYVALFDRPNARDSWSPQDWSKPALVERFVDYLAPSLEQVAGEQGVIPIMPPLEPLGAYWDTSFLQAMLVSLKRRGLGSLLQRAAVGMRNFANCRPLDWGAGGQLAWPEAKPYADQNDGQDHRGFRLFEWYQPIIRETLGHELPLIACANGPQSSQLADEPMDGTLHAERAVEMARRMMSGELPSYVFNHAFWLLGAERGQPCHSESWFEADGTARLPAVTALVQLHKRERPAKDAPSPRVQAPPVPRPRVPGNGREKRLGSVATGSQKPIDHYLLLPVFEWGVASWHLTIVQEYIAAFLPTCGFSVAEAKLARRVTIIGNEQGVSTEAVGELEAAGCMVERVAGRTGLETQHMLQELARNKQRSR